jgi:serine/threonine-protein kinase
VGDLDSTQTLDPPDDDPPTRNALPAGAAARRVALASGSAGGPSTSMEFARATLRDEETATARGMIRVGRLIGIAVAIALPFMGGAVDLRIAIFGGMVFALGIGWAIDRRLRDSARYSDTIMVVLALSVCPVTFLAMLYFGIFSAAQLFPTLAMYFFARREKASSAFALFMVNAIVQAMFAGVIISGLAEDPGLFRPSQPAWMLAIAHVLIQIGDFGAFLLGRTGHRGTRDAIEKMRRAMLLAAQRDALLAEARQDLDRALEAGGSGRYTDQTLGNYRLGAVIGRGGMGEVYEAWHVKSGEAAAIKVLPHRELGNPRAVERFLREVSAVRALKSSHVVRVLEWSNESDDLPYFAMERLHGHDLAHHLRSATLPPEALDKLLAQVGAALDEAWENGIVHRDLKPQNLFLADGGHWKVLDFGVAAFGDRAGSLTSGHVVGTPAYMSPEQARGERVDHRADVYALAAVSYRWLTGRPVAQGRDLHTALYQTVHVMPQQPSTLAELHEDVDAVLALGLVKQPERRWNRVEEMRVALADALRGELDPAVRRRAADVLAEHPWGAVRQ